MSSFNDVFDCDRYADIIQKTNLTQADENYLDEVFDLGYKRDPWFSNVDAYVMANECLQPKLAKPCSVFNTTTYVNYLELDGYGNEEYLNNLLTESGGNWTGEFFETCADTQACGDEFGHEWYKKTARKLNHGENLETIFQNIAETSNGMFTKDYIHYCYSKQSQLDYGDLGVSTNYLYYFEWSSLELCSELSRKEPF